MSRPKRKVPPPPLRQAPPQISELTARSDVDPHATPTTKNMMQLDGVPLEQVEGNMWQTPDPVRIIRDEQGRITRVQRLDEPVPRQPLKPEETETAEPVEVRPAMTLREKEQLATRVLVQRMWDWYESKLGDFNYANPIRDGIPQCKRHPYPPGCVYGCQTELLPRRYGTRGEVYQWMTFFVQHAIKGSVQRRIRGHRADLADLARKSGVR